MGAGLAFLSRLSHLTHLSLSGCTLVNDALLVRRRWRPPSAPWPLAIRQLHDVTCRSPPPPQHASAAPALQVLDLRHSRGITDDGIAHLRHAPCLRVAHFNRMNAEMQGRILGHGIARLLACATVEEMDFSGVHGVSAAASLASQRSSHYPRLRSPRPPALMPRLLRHSRRSSPSPARSSPGAPT